MMENRDIKSQNDVINYNPLAYEQKLIVNRKCRTLEELREGFKPDTNSVLSQVRDFLPKLASANDELQKRLQNEPASTFDIEEIETDRPHIQMDFALFEEDPSDEDIDSSEDSEAETNGVEITENNLKLGIDNNNKQAPVIQVLFDGADCDQTRTNCDVVNCDEINEGSNDVG